MDTKRDLLNEHQVVVKNEINADSSQSLLNLNIENVTSLCSSADNDLLNQVNAFDEDGSIFVHCCRSCSFWSSSDNLVRVHADQQHCNKPAQYFQCFICTLQLPALYTALLHLTCQHGETRFGNRLSEHTGRMEASKLVALINKGRDLIVKEKLNFDAEGFFVLFRCGHCNGLFVSEQQWKRHIKESDEKKPDLYTDQVTKIELELILERQLRSLSRYFALLSGARLSPAALITAMSIVEVYRLSDGKEETNKQWELMGSEALDELGAVKQPPLETDSDFVPTSRQLSDSNLMKYGEKFWDYLKQAQSQFKFHNKMHNEVLKEIQDKFLEERMIYMCQMCGFLAVDADETEHHVLVEHLTHIRPMNCRLCQFEFSNPGDFVKHLEEKHQELAAQNVPLMKKGILNLKRASHQTLEAKKNTVAFDLRRCVFGANQLAIPAYECRDCGSLHLHEQMVKEHVIIKHINGEKRKTLFRCVFCTYATSAFAFLRTHISSSHKDVTDEKGLEFRDPRDLASLQISRVKCKDIGMLSRIIQQSAFIKRLYVDGTMSGNAPRCILWRPKLMQEGETVEDTVDIVDDIHEEEDMNSEAAKAREQMRSLCSNSKNRHPGVITQSGLNIAASNSTVHSVSTDQPKPLMETNSTLADASKIKKKPVITSVASLADKSKRKPAARTKLWKGKRQTRKATKLVSDDSDEDAIETHSDEEPVTRISRTERLLRELRNTNFLRITRANKSLLTKEPTLQPKVRIAQLKNSAKVVLIDIVNASLPEFPDSSGCGELSLESVGATSSTAASTNHSTVNGRLDLENEGDRKTDVPNACLLTDVGLRSSKVAKQKPNNSLTMEKPSIKRKKLEYECQHCGSTFDVYSAFKSHVESNHPRGTELL